MTQALKVADVLRFALPPRVASTATGYQGPERRCLQALGAKAFLQPDDAQA